MAKWVMKTECSFEREYDNLKQSIFYDTQTKTVRCCQFSFVLNEDCTWEEQQAEPNEWSKHSCRYGHWQKEDLDIDLETAELILELLQRGE